MLSLSGRANIIKTTAKDLGFLSCGISKAEFLEEEASRLEQWLKEGKHGKMVYMENYFDKRLDPRLLVPGAKSVVSLLLNYYTEEEQVEGAPKISKYAFGTDYHFVIKDKLKEFAVIDMKKEDFSDLLQQMLHAILLSLAALRRACSHQRMW